MSIDRKPVYLLSGVRSPFAKAGTKLKDIHPAELGRATLSELIHRTSLELIDQKTPVDEVIIGNAGTPSDAANLSRVVALKAGIPNHVPAYTVHRNCASALEAVTQAMMKVQLGLADVVVAGGVESMSQMPLMYTPEAVKFFDRLSRAKSLRDKIELLTELPLKDFFSPRIGVVEGLKDPTVEINMGETAEVLVKEFKISRLEQDQFALESHQKAVRAFEEGYFKDEIFSFALPPKYSEILDSDVGPRKEQTLDALAKLKPYFDRQFGTVTVGNACPITDGAVMTLIVSEEGLKKLGNPPPLARLVDFAWAGLEPERMGLGPVYSTAKLLKKTGMRLKDFDVVEINEAFAGQVLACLKAFASPEFAQNKLNVSEAIGDIDRSRLNTKGGAIAIGHPVGATGARLMLTAAHELRRTKAKKALATLCIGGGQGGALAIESC